MVYVQGYQKVLQTFPSSSLEQAIRAKEVKQGVSTFCTPSQFPRRKLSKSIKVLQLCEKEVGWWPYGGKYRCYIALLQWLLFNSILKLNVGKDSKNLQICEKEVGWWPCGGKVSLLLSPSRWAQTSTSFLSHFQPLFFNSILILFEFSRFHCLFF